MLKNDKKQNNKFQETFPKNKALITNKNTKMKKLN